MNASLKMVVCAMLWALANAVGAQAYPSRPVKVIVPYGPGTGVEVVARLLSQLIAKNVGQTFVIEARTGAAGSIATAFVATQPADGYTLLVDSSSHTSVPALMPNLPYDTMRDFSGVTTLVENPLMMVTSQSTGFKSVRELVAAAKAKPGVLTYASAGIGTSSHISAEKFRAGAGFEALHIPFKSTTEAITELLGGRMDFTYTALTSALSGVRDGRLVALAMSARRSSVLPTVPTIVEAGVPNGAYASWIGMVVVSKTPREIVNRLNQETLKALASAELKEQLAKITAEVWTMSPEEFDVMRRRELDENERLIKAVGIKLQ